MRSADEAMLREAVAEAALGSARETLALHETERWRAELIADDDALERWLADHPDTDTQRLRSLVRAARRDAGLPPEQRQAKSHRELFQFLKPLLKP
jgi:ribosome-associated protein